MATPRVSLTDKVIKSLQNDIKEGRYSAGMRLPTEPTLTKQFGVSRTVVREAIAALKAAGILESRQGAGVYVLEQPKGEEKNTLFNADYADLSDILEVLELRMAVEIEAAGLAATRRTTAQLMKLLESLRVMENSIEAGHSADTADYEFHKAIAASTNNSRYVEFFNFLQDKVIPRSRLYKNEMHPDKLKDYLRKVLQEHHRIYSAIAANEEVEARKAMRKHLMTSRNLYQALLLDSSNQD